MAGGLAGHSVFCIRPLLIFNAKGAEVAKVAEEL